MKKITSFALLLISINVGAQSIQVQNMINYLRTREFEKAKIAADAAAVHESTKGTAKMWMCRGNVYKGIYSDTSNKVRNIDAEAEEKALDAYINCLKLDKDVIYKEEVKGPIVLAASAVNNKANFYKQNKQFENSLKCYDLLELALPFDFDNGMKRSNVTKEKILYNKFEMFKYAANKEKTKEMANKLIEIKYKEPKIYLDMIKLSLLDKDTVAALTYIEKGKLLFEENMNLIGYELDIYIARKQSDVLRDKLKKAIDVSPDNEVLHLVLGNLYKETKDIENAEKEYLKSIELKADYDVANYNLGVMYFNIGNEWNDKLNKLPFKDPKTKEYETKSNDYFKKAVVYLEKAFEIAPDKGTKQRLRQLCLRLGENEKAEKYK